MCRLRHPNVVSFLGVCKSPPCVVTEYCSRGSLTDVLRAARPAPAAAARLDWARRLNMVRPTVVEVLMQGLSYISEAPRGCSRPYGRRK